MTNEDDIPIRLVTTDERQDHYREYPPGTAVVRAERERDVPVPLAPEESGAIHRVARMERSIEALQRAVSQLQAGRDANRKLLWLVIPALVGALATVLIFAAEKIAASSELVGETKAEIRGLRERLSGQDADIRELRAALRRQSGADHPPPTSGPGPGDQNGFARLDHGAGCGVIGPQWPKVQRPHPVCGRIEHSTLLEQMSLQTLGSILSSRANSSSNVGGGSSSTTSDGEVPHAVTTLAINTTSMDLLIPEM